MRKIIASIGFVLLVLLAESGYGHFQLNVNIRIIHVEHLNDGLNLYLRLPTPYVLAQHVGEEREDGTVEPAPYTSNTNIDGKLLHYINYTAFNNNPIGLGTMIESGHSLYTGDTKLKGIVKETRLHAANRQPPFATLEEAKNIFALPENISFEQEIFVGDTVTDVLIHYPTSKTIYKYNFSSSLDPGLEDQENTANLLIDYFPGGSKIFRATGLIAKPFEISRSAISAGLTFVKEGIVHILKGYDHVLFVICLVIGASTIASLLWRVTGFTLGHTVTLSAGFFGWTPDFPWFVPAIETGIALSIIYAASIALAKFEQKSTFFITAAIGLLHGLGFSFVLQEILQINSPGIWQSLLAFNIGVEIGQVVIVLIIWSMLYGLSRAFPSITTPIRWTIALPCIVIAALWTGQRLVPLWNAIGI